MCGSVHSEMGWPLLLSVAQHASSRRNGWGGNWRQGNRRCGKKEGKGRLSLSLSLFLSFESRTGLHLRKLREGALCGIWDPRMAAASCTKLGHRGQGCLCRWLKVCGQVPGASLGWPALLQEPCSHDGCKANRSNWEIYCRENRTGLAPHLRVFLQPLSWAAFHTHLAVSWGAERNPGTHSGKHVLLTGCGYNALLAWCSWQFVWCYSRVRRTKLLRSLLRFLSASGPDTLLMSQRTDEMLYWGYNNIWKKKSNQYTLKQQKPLQPNPAVYLKKALED